MNIIELKSKQEYILCSAITLKHKYRKIEEPFTFKNPKVQEESNAPRFGGQNVRILIGDWGDQLALITNVFQKDGEYIYHIITGYNEKLIFKEQELVKLNVKVYEK